MQWHPWYVQIAKMDPDSLYVDAAADPAGTPVYRWNPDDDMHLLGFRLADSLEDLVGMWLELFEHGLFYDHDRLRWATTDAIADVSVQTLRSAWTGSEFLARLGLEQAAANNDPSWRRP